MATLDELVVRIKADASQLERGMRQAESAVRTSGDKMGGALGNLKDQFRELIPVISVAALVEFGKGAIDAAGHFQDLADRIGFSSQTITALEPALAASGSSVDEFAAGMNKLNDAIGNASKGDQSAIKNFDQLGLSVAKLKALTPEEQFYAVAEALGKITNQARLTEAGTNLMGRGFVALQPALKESGGDLRSYVEQQNKLGESLGADTISKIDNFGDAMTKAGIKIRNGFLSVFGDIAPLLESYIANLEHGISLIANIPQESYDAGRWLVGQATGKVDYGEQFGPLGPVQGPPAPGKSAAGSNAGLLNASPVEEYLKKLQQQKDMLALSDRDAAGAQAEYDLKNLAAKDKTIKLTETQIAQARALAIANFDAAHAIVPPDPDNSEMTKYLDNLRDETDALGLSEKQLAVRKELTSAQAAAQKDFNDGLRDTSLLTDEEIEKTRLSAGAKFDLTDALTKTKHAAEEMTDALTQGLTDAILHFDSATKSAGAFAESIAGAIIKAQITGPLAQGITDNLTGDGTKSLFAGAGDFIGGLFGGGKALGGAVSGGTSYLVGEEGPEVFTPSMSGIITPSDKLGGGNNFTQVLNISPGLPETVNTAIRNAAPQIAAAAKAMVLDAAQRGGSDTRMLRGT